MACFMTVPWNYHVPYSDDAVVIKLLILLQMDAMQHLVLTVFVLRFPQQEGRLSSHCLVHHCISLYPLMQPQRTMIITTSSPTQSCHPCMCTVASSIVSIVSDCCCCGNNDAYHCQRAPLTMKQCFLPIISTAILILLVDLQPPTAPCWITAPHTPALP